MIIGKIINKFSIIFILIIYGCSGSLVGFNNLDEAYKNNIRNKDISIYYNKENGHIVSAIQNVSNVFMTNLNIALECEQDNGNIITDIHSLSNLKTYYYKNIAFNIDYEKCRNLILEYIYYPEEDAGFIYRDKFGSYPMPMQHSIPVEGFLIIK